MTNQLVILAGGLGTRLRPYTLDVPKPMVRISGKPFIQYQIELAISNGIKELILCVGYKSKVIREFVGDGCKFGLSVKYSDEGDILLGTGGAIAQTIDLLDKEFFVINGDSYLPIDFSKPLLAFHRSRKKALMTVYKNNNNIYKSSY